MTAGSLTVFLYYLANFFKPVQDLAKMTNSIAQTAVGVERVRAILDADDVIPQKAGCEGSATLSGRYRCFENVGFYYSTEVGGVEGCELSD